MPKLETPEGFAEKLSDRQHTAAKIEGTNDECQFDCSRCANQRIDEIDQCWMYEPHPETWGICLNYKLEKEQPHA